jgi:hypothetical protein
MSASIRTKVTVRGISRLCHFTPSRNLLHIATDPNGILSTAALQQDEKAILNATDLARYDQHPSHVCCSIQYPNAWYFKKARNNGQTLFADWGGTHQGRPPARQKFCERNAAANWGSGIAEGEAAFDSMFKDRVTGAYSNVYVRSDRHPAWLTTDEQAEVLIPDRVAREDILGVVVASESQARREHARLKQLHADLPPLFVVPEFFDEPRRLSELLRTGRPPAETRFDLGDAL